MNVDQLAALFERVSEAPDAVNKLRRFVLELAVRGKLVERDRSDESAVDLLGRVIVETARRAKLGEFREPRNVVTTSREKLTFRVPEHWVWARLIDIADVGYGFAFTSSRFNRAARGMPLIRIRDISNDDTEAYFDGPYDQSYIVRNGDYLVGMDGEFNLRRWRGGDALLNQRVLRIRNWRAQIDPEFIRLPLQFILNYLHIRTSQTTVKHLSAKQVNGIEVPLPPLAEQQRIVARVDDLLILCDQLEAARTDREHCRSLLTTATLAALEADGEDPARLHFNRVLALDQFSRLTADGLQIGRLRKSILSHAVRGQLVPQLPCASQLENPLSQMALQWHKIDKTPPANLTSANEWRLPYAKPAGWSAATMDDVRRPGETITYGILKPVWVVSGVPTVRVTEMKTGIIDTSRLLMCEPTHARKFSKTTLVEGDLLVSKDGTIGRTAFVPPELAGGNITQHMLRVPISDEVDRRFIRMVVDAPFCQAWMVGETKGVALQGVNVGDFRRMPIPIPPLAEQRRIVARVDELMALCDQLEASLAAAQVANARLLDAILHEALHGVSLSEAA